MTQSARKTSSAKPKQKLKRPDVTKTVKTPKSLGERFLAIVKNIPALLVRPFVRLYQRLRRQRAKASHHSFVLTRKRDKPSKPEIEGLFRLGWVVWAYLLKHKGLFARFLLLYIVLTTALVGVIQGENLSNINQIVDEIGQQAGSLFSPLMQSLVIVGSSMGGALTGNLTEVQQLYMVALYIFASMVVIWLLRQLMAGNKVKLRDGLYNAGSPVVAVMVLVAVAVLQLIPFAFLALIFNTALSSGLLAGGIETAMFSIALFLGAVLTLYFMTTTIFALMIVTVPGTYPLRAYVLAKQIITGQRGRLLMRLVWLGVNIVIFWFVVMVPVVLIANATNLQSTPLVTISVQLTTGLSIVYASAYCYLLYRRMINDPAK